MKTQGELLHDLRDGDSAHRIAAAQEIGDRQLRDDQLIAELQRILSTTNPRKKIFEVAQQSLAIIDGTAASIRRYDSIEFKRQEDYKDWLRKSSGLVRIIAVCAAPTAAVGVTPAVALETKIINVTFEWVNEKSCPFSAEPIRVSAKVCMYCGHEQPDGGEK